MTAAFQVPYWIGVCVGVLIGRYWLPKRAADAPVPLCAHDEHLWGPWYLAYRINPDETWTPEECRDCQRCSYSQSHPHAQKETSDVR